MELKITKEKVLAAAEKCSTAKDVLKSMFPEAFEIKGGVKVTHWRGGIYTDATSGYSLLSNRNSGLYENKAFALSNDFEWEIKLDHQGILCLIPIPKKQFLTFSP
jgi:hypothetical protein